MKFEQDKIHAPYEQELDFYDYVKNGDVQSVQRILKERPIEKNMDEMGLLSLNPVRNLRYHAIISIAMMTRFCIEGGMDTETAYGLSDVYIRQLDVTGDAAEIQKLNEKFSIDFAKRMRNIRKNKVYSKNIVQCIDYIYKHVDERMTQSQVADYCNLHPSYLSRLFKQEVGMGVSEYIRKVKVETAEHMLKYSNDSYLEIANNLCFSSQSHFVKVFKEYTGLTPKEYRDKYYRTSHFVLDKKDEK